VIKDTYLMRFKAKLEACLAVQKFLQLHMVYLKLGYNSQTDFEMLFVIDKLKIQ